MKYRFTIFGNLLYKEIEFDNQKYEAISIGTDKECSIRLSGDVALSDFRIDIINKNNTYIVTCSDNIYLQKSGGIRNKLYKLSLGDCIDIKYEKIDVTVFSLNFGYAYSNIQDNYNRKINFPENSSITVGGSGCALSINNSDIKDEYIIISNDNGSISIDNTVNKFGVYLNGVFKNDKKIAVKINDFIGFCGCLFFVSKNAIYTTDSDKVTSSIGQSLEQDFSKIYKYPKFYKSVRQLYKKDDEKIEILPPKQLPTKPKQNLVLTLLPMILMLAVMIFIRSKMSSGSIMYVLYFAASMCISGFVSVAAYINSNKDYKKEVKERRENYNKYLDKKEEEIVASRNKEALIERENNPSMKKIIEYTDEFNYRLFERKKEHDDFVSIRVGKGIVKSENQIEFKEQEYIETSDKMMDYPKQIHDKYEYITDMPVTIGLKDINAVGFVGSRNVLSAMLKNIIIELASQQFYGDVKLVLMMDDEDKDTFKWARWYRNFDIEGSFRGIMYDDRSSKNVLELLYSELSIRDGLKKGDISLLPYFVILVYRSEKMATHPISEYVKKAESLGFTFVFFEEQRQLLNPECMKIVYMDENTATGYVKDADDGNNIQNFALEYVEDADAYRSARKLGCVYVDEVNLENTLTKNISLYELLGIMNIYELNLEKRWENSKVYESMAAPLGVKSGGEMVYLDLHEKFHGPHGLVAGTTGSGKSEILQTYILSMATLFNPYEVGFIIIDFKGGGMANQFKDLPHLNGAITNIDGKQINRSLMSIKAELLKRQELFARYGVNKIDDYIRLFKEGVTDIALPHLILIVDEFAELKSEQPEFMKELISAARIGRSLGVHLILATQKPSGVVNDQIWSNSRFKLCLKVQDKNDSKEVLKSPLAAEIREPGRAYLQVGNNEIFELFQSAYSGAPVRVGQTSNIRKFAISKVELSGERYKVYEQKISADKKAQTQLDAIVDYVKEYCIEHGITKLPDICLPPLESQIAYPNIGEAKTTDIVIPIGIYDDPAKQQQNELEINFTNNHIFILGSALSGKTYLMQSMIYGLTKRYSPSDVNIYILDFASRIMRVFDCLSHVGGIVTLDQDDRLMNMIKFLEEQIENRRKILSNMGLSSFGAYREAGNTAMPQIVLFLDNYAVFRAVHPEFEDRFITICRDGVAAGISIVVSTQQLAGIGFKLLTNFSVRIAMHCNDRSQYQGLIDRCKTYPDDVHGRAVTLIGNDVYEFQSYLAFSIGKEIDRAKKIKEYIDEINKKYSFQKALKLKCVPDEVTSKYIKDVYGIDTLSTNGIVSGIRYKDTEPLVFELQNSPAIIIMGKDDFGKAEHMVYLRKYLDTVCMHDGYEMYEILEKDEECKEKLDAACQRMREDVKHVFLLVNGEDVVASLDSDADAVQKFRELITKSNGKATVIFNGFRNSTISGLTPIEQIARDNGEVIFFDDVENVKFRIVPAQVLKGAPKIKEKGICFNIKTDGRTFRIKAILDTMI